MGLILAGTGHRPPVLFTENYYSKLNKDRLINFCMDKIIKIQHSNKIDKIISGMAQGWDLALAVSALGLDIPLLAAVPFEGMEVKWPQESQDEYKDILSRASEVVYVCEPGYSASKFYKRDQYMVDNATEMLALYNGNETGGTAITVKYANEVGKKINNCWEDWIKYAK